MVTNEECTAQTTQRNVAAAVKYFKHDEHYFVLFKVLFPGRNLSYFYEL